MAALGRHLSLTKIWKKTRWFVLVQLQISWFHSLQSILFLAHKTTGTYWDPDSRPDVAATRCGQNGCIFITRFHWMLTPSSCGASPLKLGTPRLYWTGKTQSRAAWAFLASAHEIRGPGMQLLFTSTCANILGKAVLKSSQQLYYSARKKKVKSTKSKVKVPLSKSWANKNVIDTKEGRAIITGSPYFPRSLRLWHRVKANRGIETNSRNSSDVKKLSLSILTDAVLIVII